MNTQPDDPYKNIAFRSMLPEDLDVIMRNETRSYAFPWTRGVFLECMSANYQCRVMCFNNPSRPGEVEEVVGHSILTAAAGEAHLLNVCVSRDYQGEGLGRYLVVHMLDLARSLNIDVVFLEVRPSNRVALGLYHSLGFNEIGLRKNYYPSHLGQEDARVFALQLKLD